MYDNDYLAHYGVKGQKWGVRRFQNKDGSLTSAGKKRRKYLDEDESLTRAGKKQLSKINNADQWDNQARLYRRQSESNIERFGNRKDPISKALTKTNTMYISQLDKQIEKNKKRIDSMIKELKSQKVDVVLRWNPYTESLYYKQSDAQKIKAKDNKLYRKEGIKITRDDEYRIENIKSENVDPKTVKRMNKIAVRGYY